MGTIGKPHCLVSGGAAALGPIGNSKVPSLIAGNLWSSLKENRFCSLDSSEGDRVRTIFTKESVVG